MGLVLFAYEILSVFLYILPAMVANGTPVVIHGLPPMDMGKKLNDGRRVFGDGKTWGGFIAGIAGGLIIGGIESLFIGRNFLLPSFISSIGALVGDLLASFIKRRMGLKRGESAPILDQLDFYVGSLAFLYAFLGIRLNVYAIILFALLIYGLHRTTNYIAYKLKLKSVPW